MTQDYNANSTNDAMNSARSNYRERSVFPGGIYSREDDAIDIKRIVSTILAWRKAIFGTTLLAGVLAMLYLAFATPSYLATAQLLIERQQKIIPGDDIAPGLNTGRYIIGQVIESHILLLRSPRIAERVLRRLMQPEVNGKIPVGKDAVSEKVSRADAVPNDKAESSLAENKAPLPSISVEICRADAAPNDKAASSLRKNKAARPSISQNQIKFFLRNLDVRRIGQSLIIQVSYSHENPKMAARIAKSVTKA